MAEDEDEDAPRRGKWTASDDGVCECLRTLLEAECEREWASEESILEGAPTLSSMAAWRCVVGEEARALCRPDVVVLAQCTLERSDELTSGHPCCPSTQCGAASDGVV